MANFDAKDKMQPPLIEPLSNSSFQLKLGDVRPSILGANLLKPCEIIHSASVDGLDSTPLKFQPSPCLTNAEQSKGSTQPGNGSNAEQEERLTHIFNTLSRDIPKFFSDMLDYNVYRKDVVFENSFRGKRTVGLYQYMKEGAKLRVWGHLNYAFVKIEILKITKHTEDSTIKVRWRIVGTAGTRVIFTFWRYKIGDIKRLITEPDTWMDGFSTFYVGEDGKIYRHTADKVMPDEYRTPNIVADLPGAKLMLFVSLSSEITPMLGF